ncbi:MAG: hypothetical protein HC830_11660 [Bacteroidetes bacterium]|nr:hypothetical protein [Bacteroidota bacterium]
MSGYKYFKVNLNVDHYINTYPSGILNITWMQEESLEMFPILYWSCIKEMKRIRSIILHSI